MNEEQQKEYTEKRTGCCPFCKTKISDEVEAYVRKEVIKGVRDPSYKLKPFSEK